MGQTLEQPFEIKVAAKCDVVPVVQAGPLQCPVIHSKTRHAHDMEIGVRRSTKTGDVSCIRRNFWFQECDVHHFRKYGHLAVPNPVESELLHLLDKNRIYQLARTEWWNSPGAVDRRDFSADIKFCFSQAS